MLNPSIALKLGLGILLVTSASCSEKSSAPEASVENAGPPAATAEREQVWGDNWFSVPVYFPLRDNAVWIYAVTSRNGESVESAKKAVVRVAGSRIEDGVRVASMSNYLFPICPAKTEFRDKSGYVSELFAGQCGIWYPWCDFGRQASDIDLPKFGADCFHGSRGFCHELETLTVPAGTFTEVATIRYSDTPCSDLGLVRECLAPGIGLIQRTIVSFAGEETWSLVYAEIGNEIWGDIDAPPSRAKGSVRRTLKTHKHKQASTPS